MSDMTTAEQYLVLEWCFSNPTSMQALSRWDQQVVGLLAEAFGGETANLLTVRPDKARSLGYDVGSVHHQGKWNGMPYLISQLSASRLAEDLHAVVASDEFTLGRVVVTRGELTPDRLQNVLITWERNWVLAGVELFCMGSDGMCLYWYNPADPEAAQQLVERHLAEADFLLAL